MIDFLLGVPGKLKTISDYLTTYWTSARAAKLDLLTVAPAPASTALTNATWTDARALKLDGIVASVINSIQHGSTYCYTGLFNDYTGTTTITAVNLSKSMLVLRGLRDASAGAQCNAMLTNTTTVSAGQSGNSAATVHWTVIEFK